MSQTPPQTLGKYQVIREIARSNDIVYEAYDPTMNRRVALKELAVPPGSTEAQRDDRLKRFMREAKAAGSLSHPNIVTVFDVDQDGDRTFLAMEYLTGHNLRNALDTKGRIEPLKAVEIAIEVLKGLEFAHSHGVVHRDIKPDNIQILDEGQIKITDFGIARLTFEPNLTMDGQIFGTPSYMSPEQIHGREIDARSDLFSLGSVLYEMVAGAKAFPGDSVVSISHAILNVEPQQPAEMTYPLWQAVDQAIQKSPNLRFASAKEMQSVLESVRAQMISGDVVLQPAPPPTAYPSASQYPAATSGPMFGVPYNPAPQPPPHPTYGQQLPAQLPMPHSAYYYRPARPPLMSPAAKVLLTRVMIATVLVAALLGFGAALVVAMVRVLEQGPPSSQSVPAAQPANVRSEAVPSPPPGSSSEPEDPRATGRRAISERDPGTRQRLWSDAASAWTSEIERSHAPMEARTAAVGEYLDLARTAHGIGATQAAREALMEAENFAGDEPRLIAEVTEAWQSLFGQG